MKAKNKQSLVISIIFLVFLSYIAYWLGSEIKLSTELYFEYEHHASVWSVLWIGLKMLVFFSLIIAILFIANFVRFTIKRDNLKKKSKRDCER